MKIPTLILFFVLICNVLFSQDINKAWEYFNSENYSKAAAEFESLLPEVRIDYGTEDTSYLTKTMFYVALSYKLAGNSVKAENYYVQTKIIYEKSDCSKNTWYSRNLNNLAGLYKEQGKYEKAEPLYQLSCNIYKEVNGVNSIEHATLLNNLADLYNKMGKYSEAEPLYLEVINIDKNIYSENDPNYAFDLNNIGGLYYNMKQYDKAATMYLHALEIRKVALGEKHPQYLNTLNSLAYTYYNLGIYDKAEPLFKDAVKIIKSNFGDKSKEYASAIISLAENYKMLWKIDKSEALFLEALSITKAFGGEYNTDYLAYINSLANLYFKDVNYSKAEKYFSQILRIEEQMFGKNSSEFAKALNNVGLMHEKMGMPEKAESEYLEAINIYKNASMENHPLYATSLSNLAGLYINLGIYKKAEPMLLQVLKIDKNSGGEKSLTYAKDLNNLALLYKRMEKYDKPEYLYLDALKIYKDSLGENHPDYLNTYNNLALLYDDMQLYAKEESIYLNIINIQKTIYGEKSPLYALTLNNLAALYATLGDFKKAESLLQNALNILKANRGENHPHYLASLNNLAALYLKFKKYDKAEILLKQSNNIMNQQIQKDFNFLTEKEKEAYIKNVEYMFDIYHSFVLKRKQKKPEITIQSFNNELAHKGIILQSSIEFQRKIFTENNPDLKNIYTRLLKAKHDLSIQYSLTIDKRIINTDSLENIANGLEKEIYTKSKNQQISTNKFDISWKDIQAALKRDEVAIEFISFRNYSLNNSDDSILYCALIVRPGYKQPVMQYLFEEKQLQKLIERQKDMEDYKFITNIYKISKARQSKSDTLYQLIWQPLEKYLNGSKTIYYAPSGILHKISFSAIPCNDSALISDKYQLSLLSSTKNILSIDEIQIENKNKSAVVYGGIDYDMPIEKIKVEKLNPSDEKRSLIGQLPDSLTRGANWGYLPGSLEEANKIDSVLSKKISPDKLRLITSESASEESLKALSGNNSPNILHIATHGFFFEDPKHEKRDFSFIGDVEFYKSENPLLRSGILLAGGNRAWSEKSAIKGRDDGVLTAYEISQLYFLNTNLVVMSACETGLGDINGGEGVFGLQRAFKMAGVKNIIMSLWTVPDKQTQELMTFFYENYMNGNTIRQSFINSQDKMKKMYKNMPFAWAAFVLVE